MIKVLFIHHAVGWGGAPLNMINIINSLDKNKYKARVLLLRDSVVRKILCNNNIDCCLPKSLFYKKYYRYYSHTEAGFIKWYHIYKQAKNSALWLLSRYWFAKKELQGLDCDIIHLNSSVLTDWLAPSKNKCKVIYHVQEPLSKGTFGLRLTFFRYLVKKHANQIVAISQDNAERIGIPEKTKVIYNFAKKFNGLPSKESYKSKRVLYLGGAECIKGFYTLVEALDYLDKDIKVLFCGNYEKNKTKNYFLKRIIGKVVMSRNKKEKAIEKINKHECVEMIGMIENVDYYLQEVCCLVSPFSVSHFSRPVIEAHLYKKPVIVSDVRGMSEIVKNGVNGYIVPKNNSRALADAINLLTSDPEKAMEFGNAGYNNAIKQFTDKNVQLFERLYSELTLKN